MNINADIVRVEQTPDGTFGTLLLNGAAFCCTLELPWKGNARRVSCIPAGRYACQRVKSPKFGDTFEVTGIPGRSAILFHAGNTVGDTNGCILLGSEFGKLRGERGILNSGATFRRFLLATRTVDGFALTVRQC